MEIKIQAIHFEAADKLEAFIQKKVSRLSKYNDQISLAEITLKVIKPETNTNKEAGIKIFAPGCEFYAQEITDTFEEAVDMCVDKLERQILKAKEKQSPKK